MAARPSATYSAAVAAAGLRPLRRAVPCPSPTCADVFGAVSKTTGKGTAARERGEALSSTMGAVRAGKPSQPPVESAMTAPGGPWRVGAMKCDAITRLQGRGGRTRTQRQDRTARLGVPAGSCAGKQTKNARAGHQEGDSSLLPQEDSAPSRQARDAWLYRCREKGAELNTALRVVPRSGSVSLSCLQRGAGRLGKLGKTEETSCGHPHTPIHGTNRLDEYAC